MWRAKAVADRLNIGTKDEMEVTGYKPSRMNLALTVVLTIFTGGLLLILLTWRPSIKLSLTHKRCPLKEAKRVLLKDIYNQQWEEEVKDEEFPDDKRKENCRRVYFVNKNLKYVWDEISCVFIRLRPLDSSSTFNSFHQKASGLSSRDAKSRKVLYGENFMKIEILSIWQLLVQQAVNPFYIFQFYTIILWCLQDYFLFSGCILGLSIISITVMVWETRRQSCALRQRVTTESNVTVLRDGQRNIISSRDVVPGDVLILKEGMECMEVDAVLLEGSVITNEAMLTGESIPITKVAVPIGNDTMFCEEEHKHHMLYSGTAILQVRGGKELMALTVKTGFYTTRGELVRSILFPKPVDFHFYSDFLKMLFVFIILGLAAMSWSLYHFIQIGASWKEILFNSLDLVTFVVPPILPATITAINAGAQLRLKRSGIFCLSSNYISLAGSVDVVCFDKTGTLTENDLSLAGVIPCQKGELLTPIEDLTTLSPDLLLTKALATCHSLSKINEKLAGYPLDVKIFSGIDWTLVEPEAMINQDYGMVTPMVVYPNPGDGRDRDQQELAILKTFPFESQEQRMTVVTKRKTSTNFEVYFKGAPEMVASLCNRISVPVLMESALEWYTRQGLRVVAVAGLTLPNDTTWEEIDLSSREMLESGAEFLGFVVLQNRVKPETPSVITTLHSANISTVMITGDNLLTAVSVARQSGLLTNDQQLIVVKAKMVSSSAIAAQHLQVDYYDVDQIDSLYDKRKLMSVRNENYVLAADGTTFDLIFRGQDKNLFLRLIQKGKIFARMKPDQKITVVETLQDLGHQVAMCGDGCNDCGALKVANAGISLSSSEASVAAPFTSKTADVECVPILIREGRAAHVSLFTAFKYTVSMCFGALICVLFQFSINTMPTDKQYLIMDLVLGTIPALVIGNTSAGANLVPKRPTQRILSPLPALSMLSFLGLQTLTYWSVLAYIRSQLWFEPFRYNGEVWSPNPSYENTVLMLVNFHSFNIGVVVYSHAFPYRKQMYTNIMLTVYFLLSVAFCLFITFCQEDWLINFLNFREFPDAYMPAMLFFAVSVYCLVSLIWERWVLYGLMEKYVLSWINKTCGPHALHTKLERALRSERTWPPLSDPPEMDATVASHREPLKAKESLDIYEESNDNNDDSILIRKLTRRYKFKASVKYVNEGPGSPLYSTGPIDAILTRSAAPGPQQQLSPPPESYQVPWDAQGNNDNVFKFNMSIRGQIMKGTGGGFRTFKKSLKMRQGTADTNTAEPYEVIHLAPTNEPAYEDGDEIYSTIPDSPSHYAGVMNQGEPQNQIFQMEQEFPVSQENGAAKSLTPTEIERGPESENFTYDVPQPPRPLDGQTRTERTANEDNIPHNLMSRISYIDDEHNESYS